jgi:hypothetical protein
MTSSRALVSAYWAAAEARDWAAFGRLLTDDWHLAVQRIVADEGTAASWIAMTDPGETYPGLTFFEIADGLITRITDFWPQPYEPSADRAHLTERI